MTYIFVVYAPNYSRGWCASKLVVAKPFLKNPKTGLYVCPSLRYACMQPDGGRIDVEIPKTGLYVFSKIELGLLEPRVDAMQAAWPLSWARQPACEQCRPLCVHFGIVRGYAPSFLFSWC